MSKAPWRLSTTRPGVSLTLCSTSLCLSKLFFESFSCDLEQQVEESLPPAFLSPLGILRKYEKWDCNNETSFSTRSHEGGTATQALLLHLTAGMPVLGDGVDSTRDILSEEFRNFTDQLRTVTSQQDRWGNSFISYLIEPRAGQKWERKIQIIQQIFFECLLCGGN